MQMCTCGCHATRRTLWTDAPSSLWLLPAQHRYVDSYSVAAGSVLKQNDAGPCDAMFAGMNSYKTLKSDQEGTYCDLTRIGSPLYSNEGSWVVNLKSSCVAIAIDHAFFVLNDKLAEAEAKWFPPAVCGGGDDDSSALNEMDELKLGVESYLI